MIQGKELTISEVKNEIKKAETHLTIVQAWNELKGIQNEIDLYETLLKTKYDIKSTSLKDILVSGGKLSNDKILEAITRNDNYSNKLYELYVSKCSYEKYIWEEINRLKKTQQSIIIGFLKEYQELKWREISDIMNYEERQCRRYYDEYKGRTTRENGY